MSPALIKNLKNIWYKKINLSLSWLFLMLSCLFIIFAGIFIEYLYSINLLPKIEAANVLTSSTKSIDSLDTYWSTIFPVLVAYLVTILGSMITVYIFMKQAMDNMVDSRRYYENVISHYRNSIVQKLKHYTIINFIVMAIFVMACLMEWGKYKYFSTFNKVFWCITVGISCFRACSFLLECIGSEIGLHREAYKLLIQQEKEMETFLSKAAFKGNTPDKKVIIGKFGINEEEISSCSQFIYQFSKWEEFLILMVTTSGEQNLISADALETSIKTGFQYADKLFYINKLNKIEENDAAANEWNDSSSFCHIKKERKQYEQIKADDMNSLYLLLSKYRNTLKVYEDTHDEKNIKLNNGEIVYRALYYFVQGMTVKYFRAIPRVEIFYPSAYLKTVDFYNVRFEKSSFRASRFENVIMARSRAIDSNFNISYFEKTNFYGSDFRNCAFSNCYLSGVRFNRSIFHYVDFSSTIFSECQMHSWSVKDSILENISFENCDIRDSDFDGSRLWKVKLKIDEDCRIQNCSFKDTDIREIQIFHPSNTKNLRPSLNAGEEFRQIIEFGFKQYNWDDGRIQDTLSWKPEDKQSQFLKLYSCIKNEYLKNDTWKKLRNFINISMNDMIFSNAVMNQVHFFYINFEQSIFINTRLCQSNLAFLDMEGSVMTNVNLHDSKMFFLNLSSTELSKAIFYKAHLLMINLSDSSLVEVIAEQAFIKFCILERSDCSQINLTSAFIEDCCLDYAILARGEFTGTQLKRINIRYGNCNGCQICGAKVVQCDFSQSALKESIISSDTSFLDCDFTMTNFMGSTITNSTFNMCDFKEVEFCNTIFINVFFENCYNLTSESFENCHFINTTWSANEQNYSMETYLKPQKKSPKRQRGNK